MWSDELQKQTREYFKKMPASSVKHFNDLCFGTCMLIKGEYVITEHNTNAKHKFDSIEALIQNGWVID